jgi:hypothetical protein
LTDPQPSYAADESARCSLHLRTPPPTNVVRHVYRLVGAGVRRQPPRKPSPSSSKVPETSRPTRRTRPRSSRYRSRPHSGTAGGLGRSSRRWSTGRSQLRGRSRSAPELRFPFPTKSIVARCSRKRPPGSQRNVVSPLTMLSSRPIRWPCKLHVPTNRSRRRRAGSGDGCSACVLSVMSFLFLSPYRVWQSREAHWGPEPAVITHRWFTRMAL